MTPVKEGALFFAVLLVSCGLDSSVGTTTTTTFTPHPSTTGVPEPTLVTSTSVDPSTTSDSLTSTSTTEASTHPTTTGVLPDFGSLDGCGGKIDVLFAIDRHFYMENFNSQWDQARDVILPQAVEWFANFDTHWLVATPHEIWGIEECVSECSLEGTCYPVGPPTYPCEGYEELTSCDTTRGAGLTFPAGFKAANKRCITDRFARSEANPDLLDSLECLTDVGWTTHGGVFAEWGMVEAIRPSQTKVPGGCNLGFLRDDALLFVVLVSRYAGKGASPAGTPEEWASSLYSAKGDKDKVVVLGIVNDRSVPNGVCEGEDGLEEWGDDVVRFLHVEIEHSVLGSICADDYAPFFKSAMTQALNLCGAAPPT